MTANKHLFVLASAVTISLAACGRSGNGNTDSTSMRGDSTAMVPATLPATTIAIDSSLMRDSLARDSVRRADSGRAADSLRRGRGGQP